MLGSGIAGYLIGKPGRLRRSSHRRRARHRNRDHAAPPAPHAAGAAPSGPGAGTLDGAHADRPAGRRARPNPSPIAGSASTAAAPEAEPACLQQAAGHGRREIRRLRAHRAGGEVGAARGRRPALHRRPHLRPGLHGHAAGRASRARRRQARRRAQGRAWRWAPARPSSPCRARASSCRAAPPPACRSPPSTSPRSASRSIA